MPAPIEIVTAIGAGVLMTLVLVMPVIGLIRNNYRAYDLFRRDKRLSEQSEQRIPEWQLLEAARNWGWFGAKLAQRRFRHKTRKEPFRSDLNGIGVVLAVKFALVTLAGIYVLNLPQARDLTKDLQQMRGDTIASATATATAPEPVRPRPRPPMLGG